MAQVPTCSKFTATKLANYSMIDFILYQIWCKIYICNYPLLKIQELSQHFWRKPNLTDVNHSHNSSNSLSLNGQDYFCQWSVVSRSHWRCWWGMQEAEQGNIRSQGDSSHSPCPLRASGNKPCGQPLDVIFIAIFTGHGLAATLMPHVSSWVL